MPSMHLVALRRQGLSDFHQLGPGGPVFRAQLPDGFKSCLALQAVTDQRGDDQHVPEAQLVAGERGSAGDRELATAVTTFERPAPDGVGRLRAAAPQTMVRNAVGLRPAGATEPPLRGRFVHAGDLDQGKVSGFRGAQVMLGHRSTPRPRGAARYSVFPSPRSGSG